MDKDTQNLWPQFQEMIALHKFYFEIIIKAGSFTMAIIGGIITYAIAAIQNPATESDLISLLLLFPAVMSGDATAVFLLGTWKANDLDKSVREMKHRLGLARRPHVELLVWTTAIFALLYFLTTVGLIRVIANTDLLGAIAKLGTN
jgi:hypothetical protein